MYRRIATVFLSVVILAIPAATTAQTNSDCRTVWVYTLRCGEKEKDAKGKETGRFGGLGCVCNEEQNGKSVQGICTAPLKCLATETAEGEKPAQVTPEQICAAMVGGCSASAPQEQASPGVEPTPVTALTPTPDNPWPTDGTKPFEYSDAPQNAFTQQIIDASKSGGFPQTIRDYLNPGGNTNFLGTQFGTPSELTPPTGSSVPSSQSLFDQAVNLNNPGSGSTGFKNDVLTETQESSANSSERPVLSAILDKIPDYGQPLRDALSKAWESTKTAIGNAVDDLLPKATVADPPAVDTAPSEDFLTRNGGNQDPMPAISPDALPPTPKDAVTAFADKMQDAWTKISDGWKDPPPAAYPVEPVEVRDLPPAVEQVDHEEPNRTVPVERSDLPPATEQPKVAEAEPAKTCDGWWCAYTNPEGTTKSPVFENNAQAAKSIGTPKDFNETFYAPGAGGKMQGGFETSRKNLEGEAIPRTLDDVRLGKSNYVTLASDPANYGKYYDLGKVTYTSPMDGKTYTLENVNGYVHDTGSAFQGRPDKMDIAVGDYRGWSGRDAANQVISNPHDASGSWQQIAGLPTSQSPWQGQIASYQPTPAAEAAYIASVPQYSAAPTQIASAAERFESNPWTYQSFATPSYNEPIAAALNDVPTAPIVYASNNTGVMSDAPYSAEPFFSAATPLTSHPVVAVTAGDLSPAISAVTPAAYEPTPFDVAEFFGGTVATPRAEPYTGDLFTDARSEYFGGTQGNGEGISNAFVSGRIPDPEYLSDTEMRESIDQIAAQEIVRQNENAILADRRQQADREQAEYEERFNNPEIPRPESVSTEDIQKSLEELPGPQTPTADVAKDLEKEAAKTDTAVKEPSLGDKVAATWNMGVFMVKSWLNPPELPPDNAEEPSEPYEEYQAFTWYPEEYQAAQAVPESSTEQPQVENVEPPVAIETTETVETPEIPAAEVTPLSGPATERTLAGDTPDSRFVSPSQQLASISTPPRDFGRGFYEIGDTGGGIKDIQKFLNANGYPVAADGAGSKGQETDIYGGKTREAVVAFQKDNGLDADGYVGPKTMEKMNAIIADTRTAPVSQSITASEPLPSQTDGVSGAQAERTLTDATDSRQDPAPVKVVEEKPALPAEIAKPVVAPAPKPVSPAADAVARLQTLQSQVNKIEAGAFTEATKQSIISQVSRLARSGVIPAEDVNTLVMASAYLQSYPAVQLQAMFASNPDMAATIKSRIGAVIKKLR